MGTWTYRHIQTDMHHSVYHIIYKPYINNARLSTRVCAIVHPVNGHSMRQNIFMCIKRKKVTENVKIKKLLSHEKERKNVLLYYCYNNNAYFEKSIDHNVVVVKCFF